MKINENISRMIIGENSKIRDVLKVIDAGERGLAILVDEKTREFRGVVTDGDIRRALIRGHGLEGDIREVKRPVSVTAPDTMPPSEVSTLFSEVIRAIPILNEKRQVVDIALFDRRIHLPVAAPVLSERELRYVSECVLTGWVSSAGKYVDRFEDSFRQYCGVRHAISTSSGTTALHLALLSCGIGPGDEVIVPSLTFIATANAVRYTGATPVFVDSEEDTWNINPDLIEEKISFRTRAIIPVHLYGHPANMPPILELARERNLYVIEDAAEAHGATCYQKIAGTMGDMGIFSFYGNKIITTGEGGMLITNSAEYAEKARILRDHGMDRERRYWHPVLGYNYRMTNVQAALGLAQMERIDQILQKKRELASAYTRLLQGVRGIRLPREAPWARNVYWLYSILIDEEMVGLSRDDVIAKMKESGIETRPVFPMVHSQPIYNAREVLPVGEEISRRGISLPSSINLTAGDIERVARTVIDIIS